MKLTDMAIERIRSVKNAETHIALALDRSPNWIIRSLTNNVDNGILTTYKAISLIKEITGLLDSEILEEVSQVPAR